MRELDAIWEPTDKTLCTHPGWSTLQGWNAIRTSYARIMENQTLQFIVTGVEIRVMGEAAMVSCAENIWGEGATGTVAALNVFRRQDDGRWLMVAHHGSPVAPQRPADTEEQDT